MPPLSFCAVLPGLVLSNLLPAHHNLKQPKLSGCCPCSSCPGSVSRPRGAIAALLPLCFGDRRRPRRPPPAQISARRRQRGRPHGGSGERGPRGDPAARARLRARLLPAASRPEAAAAAGGGGGGGGRGEPAGAAGFPRLRGELVPLPKGAGEPLPAPGAARPAAAGDGGGSLQAGQLAHPRAPAPGGLLRGALPGRQHPRPLPRHHPGGRRLLPAPGGDGAAHRLQAGGGAPPQRQAAPRPLLRRLQPPAAPQPGAHRPAQAGLQPGGAHRQLLPGALHPGADGGAGGRRRGGFRRRDPGQGRRGAEPGRLRLHQVRPVAAGRRQPGAGRPPAAAPPPAGPAGQRLPGGAAAGLHGRAAAPRVPQRGVPAHGAAARRGAEVLLAAGRQLKGSAPPPPRVPPPQKVVSGSGGVTRAPSPRRDPPAHRRHGSPRASVACPKSRTVFFCLRWRRRDGWESRREAK